MGIRVAGLILGGAFLTAPRLLGGSVPPEKRDRSGTCVNPMAPARLRGAETYWVLGATIIQASVSMVPLLPIGDVVATTLHTEECACPVPLLLSR